MNISYRIKVFIITLKIIFLFFILFQKLKLYNKNCFPISFVIDKNKNKISQKYNHEKIGAIKLDIEFRI